MAKDIKFDIMGGYSKEEYNELDPQQTVNMFLVNASDGRKAGFHSPGLSLDNGIDFSAQAPDRVGRQAAVFNKKLFVNIGEKVYRCIASSKTLDHALIGEIKTQSGYVGTTSLDNQLMFVDGVDGWIWQRDISTFTQVIFGFDVEPTDVVVSGNRFIVFNKGKKNWFYSDAGTGLTWNVLHINSFQNGDVCVGGAILKDRIYVMGQTSTEIWYNAGTPIDPYRPADPTIELGCASAGSVAEDFGILVWLSKTYSGVGSIVATTGGQPQPISTQAIDTALSKISDLSDTSGYIYKNQEGHTMYRLSSTSGNKTFEYDFNTKLWNTPQHAKKKDPYGRHLSQKHAYFNSKHYVVDYSEPKLYEMSNLYFDDAGTKIRRARVSSILDAPPHNLIKVNSLTLRLKQGTGGDCGIEEEPLVRLRQSVDDGESYGNQLTAEIGRIGRRTWETTFDNGVDGRSVVFEIEYYAAKPFVMTQADLNIEVIKAM